ncbi:hypothetical protein [Vacuolonema iberomarrocanum]|uniref:hypothetical protein n=1 Tax=Vacuolonema iberomarrocanum TaxID=3454632 RepID=UPI0019F3A8B1|nr:hypothetical protein [filamentous cyanobacterium LEGE 07170]
MGLVIVVILINGSLAFACLYGAWRLWQWRSDLVQLRGTIGDAEQQLQQALAKAPLVLLQGQLELVTVRQRYVLPWQVRLQQTRRAIALVSFALSLWRRSQPRSRRSKRNRPKAQR